MRKVNYLLGITFFLLILLCGCHMADTMENTEDPATETAGEAESSEYISVEATEEESDETTEGSAGSDYISGSESTEPLVSVLWRIMLSYFGDHEIKYEGNENFQQELEEHIWKQWDENYDDVETFLTGISGALSGKQEIFVFYSGEFGNGQSWRWKERVKLTPDLYPEAEKYWTHAGSSTVGYYKQSQYVQGKIDNGLLKVTGSINKTSSELGKQQFIDKIYPYFYSGLWGSVLKESGRLYEEQYGTVLGELSGQAYLMEFSFETLEGKFWLCCEWDDPLQMIFTFENEDCTDYTLRINESAIWTETEKENAWLGMEFDLLTERVIK